MLSCCVGQHPALGATIANPLDHGMSVPCPSTGVAEYVTASDLTPAVNLERGIWMSGLVFVEAGLLCVIDFLPEGVGL